MQPATVKQFSGNLAANILAGVPIVVINYENTDKYSIYSMLTALLGNLKIELWLYGINKDGNYCVTQFALGSKPKEVDLFSFVPEEELPEEGMSEEKIILDYVLPNMGANKIFAFFSDNFGGWCEIQMQLAEKAQEFRQTLIVLSDGLNDEYITPRLRKIGFFVSQWYPNEAELALYLGQRLKEKDWAGVTLDLGDEEIRRVASLLVGSGFLEAEKKFSVFAMKHYLRNMHKEKTCVIDRGVIDIFENKIKKEHQKLESSQGLEQVKLDDFSINSLAGLENLKNWLETTKELSSPEKILEIQQMGWKPPRGVLLMGIPGCGKSLSAKCIAVSFNLPLYRLDFATVQNKWLGESERRLKEALDFADSRSPCVLWVDEIEKGLTISDNDPWTRKLLGMFLTYLQESKSNVFVVATSNDVQQLPPELLRKGRFDEMFFVDLPNEAERKDVLGMYLKKYLKIGSLSESFAKKAIAATRGFATSDIEGTLSQLGFKKLAYERTDISEEAILKSFKNATSVSKVNPVKIEAIREWGLKHAVPASGSVFGSIGLPKSVAL